MKVLIVKTSSLGDIIHTLPALSDAKAHYPDIEFHWLVESSFQEIPTWHPAVSKVIVWSWRKWRKNLWQAVKSGELLAAIKSLRAEQYDKIIDAQGLLKSAIITRFAKGPVCGPDKNSAREAWSALFYKQKIKIDSKLHAVTRNRLLFSQSLAYDIKQEAPDYGISNLPNTELNLEDNYCVFAHGTTWASKLWPLAYWRQLAELCESAKIKFLVPWGNVQEEEAARFITQNLSHGEVLPKSHLSKMAAILAKAKAIIAVDSGLGHLAAALNVPTLSLYSSTDPALTGTFGLHQEHWSAQMSCAPCFKRHCPFDSLSEVKPACFASLTSDKVFIKLQEMMKKLS